MKTTKLMMARIVWAALLFIEVAFGVVISLVIQDGASRMPSDTMHLLYVMNAVLLAAAAGIAFMLRSKMTQAGEDGLIDPGRYFTGTIIFLACCEGAALFGLVTVLLSGHFWPGVVVPALAMAVQVISFPVGKGVREE